MQFQCYEPREGVFRDMSNPTLMVANDESLLGKAVGGLARRVKAKLNASSEA